MKQDLSTGGKKYEGQQLVDKECSGDGMRDKLSDDVTAAMSSFSVEVCLNCSRRN